MRGAVFAGAVSVLMAAGCGGGGITLSGTFTENAYVSPGHGSCATQESRHGPGIWRVVVTADGVSVGTTGVHWQGGNNSQGACRAAWSMAVPAAQKAYRVTLLAVCGPFSASPGTERIASVIVQPPDTGQPVALSDAAAGGNNC